MEVKKEIDLTRVIKKVLIKKKSFLIIWVVTFVLSCLFIVCIPRTYTTETKMAPELENSGLGGTIGDLASTFGVDLGNATTSDAISPLLYPDLMEDNGFVSDMFGVKVTVDDEDRCFTTTYYEYLLKHQKKPWWGEVMSSLKKIFPKKKMKGRISGKENNPYFFTKTENDVAEIIRSKIKLNVDKQTGVITISVDDQDPVTCKCIADTMRMKLQEYITAYRTKKATIDMVHYKSLENEAKRDYERSVKAYAGLMDSNFDVVLQSVKSRQDDLENDMQLKYNTYTALHTQYEAAKAKVQERTPAFTMIKGAAVPIKASKPKRMLFVLGMLILSTFGNVIYIMRNEIKHYLLK